MVVSTVVSTTKVGLLLTSERGGGAESGATDTPLPEGGCACGIVVSVQTLLHQNRRLRMLRVTRDATGASRLDRPLATGTLLCASTSGAEASLLP